MLSVSEPEHGRAGLQRNKSPPAVLHPIGPMIDPMNCPHRSPILLIALTLFCSCCLVKASSPPNPYSDIPTRNAFALNPIPVPRPPEPIRIVPPKLTLTGITTIFGTKLALLKVHFPAAPGEPDHDLYLSLTEGETQDGFKILEIHVDHATAIVEYLGDRYTVTLPLNPSDRVTAPQLFR